MQYRKLGNTGLKVSLLGMGCMRLPFIDGDGNNGVDIDAAIELIQYAADNGINYFDSALTYHQKNSEAILGEALEKRRSKVFYVTKQPPWEMFDIPTIRRNLENTLKKLRTDYLDAYLLHRVMPTNWEEIQKRKILDEFEKFKQEGLIRHIGCSYHGDFATFKNVVETYPWEVILAQHNMLDVKREVTLEGIQIASKHGVGMAIMEPLRGGGLAHAPAPVRDVYESHPFPDKNQAKRSPAEWAFRYLANIPEISTIVSGMSNLEQLKANIELFSRDDMLPNSLTDAEKQTITSARVAYQSIVTIPCTLCNYCMPCPAGVNIPHILGIYNDAHRFEYVKQARRSYMFVRNANADVSKCTHCGKCITDCPQDINVIEQLKIAHQYLDGWVE